MDRIGKIFGRKPEQTAPLEGGKAEPLPPPAGGNVEANHKARKPGILWFETYPGFRERICNFLLTGIYRT